MNDPLVRDEIHKRLTLNWLIQGAAQHAGMTFHHLVRDELNELDHRFVRLYDQFALINVLQYWNVDGVMLLGWPPRFWRRAAAHRRHPFHGHPLLARFGGLLAAEAHTRACQRAREKGVWRLAFVFSCQALYLLNRLRQLEAPHQRRLADLARRTASTIWGIPTDRFDAQLEDTIILGNLMPARTIRGAIFRTAIVGYGAVVQRGDSLRVVARGTNWQLLAKELVKGTAELICLHGLNTLNDEDYAQVMEAADHLEYEPWMLQSGGELWRRLLAVVPKDWPMGEMLMQLALLPASRLHDIMVAVIAEPERARMQLAALAEECREEDRPVCRPSGNEEVE